MVKSTFSLGGKLLTIFLTIVIFIGVCAASLILAVTKIKARTVAGWLGMQDYISETYEGSLLDFASEIGTLLNGSVTINKILEISPGLKKQVDGIVDNVENVGLFKIDRDLLYDIAVNQMTSNLTNIVVLTATLNELADYLSVSLPDLAFIKGSEENPVDVYTQVNATEDGSADKIFTMSENEESPRSYYTRTEKFSSEYLNSEGDTLPVSERVQTMLYSLDAITVENNFLFHGGEKLYVGTFVQSEDESGHTQSVSYSPLTQNSSIIYSLEKQEDGTYIAEFAPSASQKLYKSCPPTQEHEDGYAEVTLSATGESVYTQNIAAPYRYQPLYVQADTPPEDEAYYTANGKYYVLATQTDGDNYAVDTACGGFLIREEYRNSVLYTLDYEYTQASLSDASADTAVYLYTNGIGDLPMTYGISALSSFLNTKTMTINDMSVYFGIDLDITLLEGVKYVPLAYLSAAMPAEMNSIYIDDVIEVTATSPTVLLYLAYGNGYRVSEDGTLEITDASQRRTIGQITQAMDGITVSSVVTVTEESHPLLQTIANWTLNDIGNADKIGSISLGDVMTIVTDEEALADPTGTTVASPKILQALAGVPIDGLSGAIDSLTLGQIMPIDPSDNLLGSLSGSTLQTLSQDLTTLTVQKLFADSIYSYFEVAQISPAAQDDQTPNRTRFAELQSKVSALANEYSAAQLYIYQKGTYMPVQEFIDSYLAANADVADGQDYKGEVPDALCSPYLAITADADKYADIPLYAYVLNEEGEYEYVLATQVSEWQLSEQDAQTYEGATLYTKSSASETLYEPAEKNASGYYDAERLYVWDAAAERMKSITLVPAGLSVKEEYADTLLYSDIGYACTYDPSVQLYEQGNLFYYDIDKQMLTQLNLTPDYVSDGAVQSFRGYVLAEEDAPEEGTLLYTYGEIAGVWKYLLTLPAYEAAESTDGTYDVSTLYVPVTDADGGESVERLRLEYDNGKWKLSEEDAAAYAGKTLYLERTIEASCALQQVNSLVVNVQKNINKMTLNDLYRDGMVEVTDPSKLNEKIPAVLPSYEGRTVGSLTINELLSMTFELISYLNKLPVLP